MASFAMPLIGGFILITSFQNIYKVLAEFGLILIYGLYLLGITKGSPTLKNWLRMDEEAVKSTQMISFFEGVRLAFLGFVVFFFGAITLEILF